jgi:hypothetical protein
MFSLALDVGARRTVESPIDTPEWVVSPVRDCCSVYGLAPNRLDRDCRTHREVADAPMAAP